MLVKVSKETKQEIISWIFFILLLFTKFFIYDISQIPSCSMTPTLLTGDLVVVDRHCLRWSVRNVYYGEWFNFFKKGIELGKPERGTPYVFVKKNEPGTHYLKRLVAFEGETVQMIDGILHINDKPVKMAYVKDVILLNDQNIKEKGKIYKITLDTGKSYFIYRNANIPLGYGRIDNTPKYRVPKGHVWMQGDHHTGSIDSFTLYFLGPLSKYQLICKPIFILVNSNSRGEEKGGISWWIRLPFLVIKYIINLNFKRYMIKVDSEENLQSL